MLVGLDEPDDAGVVRLTPELALVQTVDFFTPIVDEAFDYGRIAAANSLSDVWAMGGRPICAMSIVCFPIKSMALSVLNEAMRGMLDTLSLAGVPLVGGHSVTDEEFKLGLSVSGLVHPDKIWAKQGVQPGDALILTKPLGSGVVTTGIKKGKASAEALAAVKQTMATINRFGAEAMMGKDVHAATDVTGFSLVGHGWEMVRGSTSDLVIETAKLPLLLQARELAAKGCLPGGVARNRDYYGQHTDVDPGLDEHLVSICFDPQTSGGLLAALPKDQAEAVIAKTRGGPTPAVHIGYVAAGRGRVRLAK